MATDIKLEDLAWSPPDTIRGYDDNVAMIKWALTHTVIDQGWLQLRPFNCSRVELKVLRDSVANNAIPELKYDLQSAMLIFHHLSTYIRFTVDQVEALDALINDKHATMADTLRGFFPASDAEPLYKIWTMWAALGYRSFEFFREKTFYAHKICKLYGPFKKAVDELKPALNLLVLGTKSKPECQRLGAKCVQLQEPLIQAVTGYFTSNLETYHAPVQMFLRNWLEGITVPVSYTHLTLPTKRIV